MFCKWCGNTIRSTDKKCAACGRETPAMSDCGGFYDLKRPWEAETPVVEPVAIPMGGGADMATIRRLQQEKNELRQKANNRNLIMLIISDVLLLAFVVTLVLLLRSAGDNTPSKNSDGAVETTGISADQTEDNAPAEVLLGVTVDPVTGGVITTGDYDAVQVESQEDGVTVDFLWEKEAVPTEPAETTPVETAPAETAAAETTSAAEETAKAEPEVLGDTETAPSEGEAPAEAGPAETIPAETEPVETEPVLKPVTEPTPGVDAENADKLRLTVSWDNRAALAINSATAIQAKLGWDAETVEKLGLQIAYGWEFSTDGENWNYLVKQETADEDAEKLYEIEDGKLEIYEAWWNENVEEPTDLQVRCRIVVTAKNGDKVILVVDGFRISHENLKLQTPQQPEALLPEEES